MDDAKALELRSLMELVDGRRRRIVTEDNHRPAAQLAVVVAPREDLVGLPYVRELYQRGFHYVVARMELAFQRPARHGDQDPR